MAIQLTISTDMEAAYGLKQPLLPLCTILNISVLFNQPDFEFEFANIFRCICMVVGFGNRICGKSNGHIYGIATVILKDL
jgi:hypothetical protein